jgi:hypothetical protein
MDRSNARYQQSYDHCNYLFAGEGQQQQGLWERLGFERPKAPAQESSSHQQQPQRSREAAAIAGKLPAAAAAAEADGGSTATHAAAAAAGGVGGGGNASICSPPVTPQLPFWRSAGAAEAAATPGAVAAARAANASTAAAASPAAGVSSEACQTPAVQKKNTVSGYLAACRWQAS